MTRSQLLDVVRQVRDAIDWHRRLVASLLVGVAVVAGLGAVAPHRAAAERVWTAARDLTGGGPLHASDVVLRELPRAVVPAGALLAGARVAGRLLAAPMRRGEPLTDVRLLEPSLLAALDRPGLVAVPVRVGDGPAALALAHAGDVVDVLAAGPDSGPDATASVVATAVTVLTVAPREATASEDAGLVVVAATPAQAAALAAAAGDARLSLAMRRP